MSNEDGKKIGIDLTNVNFTEQGTVEGLPDDELDDVAGGLSEPNRQCSEPNQGCA